MAKAGGAKPRGRVRKVGMNKTEAEYNDILWGRQQAGEIVWYKFEAVKFKLADKTYYTPDFMVMLSTGDVELHEVKGGYFEDDARVKIKVAAALFPFPFIVAKKKNKKTPWEFEAI